jgi:hypothetical protein
MAFPLLLILGIIGALIVPIIIYIMRPEIFTVPIGMMEAPTNSTCKNALANSSNSIASWIGNGLCKIETMLFNFIGKYTDPAHFFFLLFILTLVGLWAFYKWQKGGKHLLIIFLILAVVFLYMTFG